MNTQSPMPPHQDDIPVADRCTYDADVAIAMAETYADQGEPVPTDLTARLLELGIDASTI